MKKLFALLLAAVMVFGLVACGEGGTSTKPGTANATTDAPVVASDPYAGKTHAEISDDLYMKVLGEFDTAYTAAKEA